MAKESESGYRSGHKAWSPWYILLLAPFVGVLWVPFFNSIEPTWMGIPFFYWYQFLWVAISSVITLVVYFATKKM
jgi:FtsH-binding integral membrane protein